MGQVAIPCTLSRQHGNPSGLQPAKARAVTDKADEAAFGMRIELSSLKDRISMTARFDGKT
jgi:hypothetical protein